jgi:hypothetical protein
VEKFEIESFKPIEVSRMLVWHAENGVLKQKERATGLQPVKLNSPLFLPVGCFGMMLGQSSISSTLERPLSTNCGLVVDLLGQVKVAQ